MNGQKIVGNFLVGFAVPFIAASWVGGADALIIASINAVIFGALAVGKELQEDALPEYPVAAPLLSKAVLL